MVYLIGNEAELSVDHRSTSFLGAAASSEVISLICCGLQ